jgi:hypothetical protein
MLALVSPIIYARAIFRGEAIPHRTTRIVLLVNTILATSALFAQHDTVAIWLAGVSTIQSVFIFALSLKYGTGGWAKLDMACLAIAVIGMILWKSTDNPTIALYSSILSDFVGMIPTLVKTYKRPSSEIWQFFAIDTVVGLLSLLAVSHWTPASISYPLYILLVNMSVALLVIYPRKKIVVDNPLQ